MNRDFLLAINDLALYYDKAVSDAQLKIFAAHLEKHLTIEQSRIAINLYIEDPENKYFPIPISRLIALIKKPVSNADQSNLVAVKLIAAMKKHGHTWSDGFYHDGKFWYIGSGYRHEHFKDAVDFELGPLAFKVIETFGGWTRLCEYIRENPEGVVTAQIQRIFLSTLNSADTGERLQQIESGGAGLQRISAPMKLIESDGSHD